MKALKDIKIGFISAYNLLMILIPTTIAAAVFFGAFFITTPMVVRVIAGAVTFVGMSVLAMVMIGAAAYIYGEKQPEH